MIDCCVSHLIISSSSSSSSSHLSVYTILSSSSSSHACAEIYSCIPPGINDCLSASALLSSDSQCNAPLLTVSSSIRASSSCPNPPLSLPLHLLLVPPLSPRPFLTLVQSLPLLLPLPLLPLPPPNPSRHLPPPPMQSASSGSKALSYCWLSSHTLVKYGLHRMAR
jgi:hypothetical protein